MSTQLSQLQDAATLRAEFDSFFQYTHCFALRQLQTASQIEEAVACIKRKNDKAGTSLIVMMPQLSCEHPAMSGPQMKGRITLRALENPKANSSGVTAEELAFRCLDLYHNWAPGFINGPILAAKDSVQPSIAFAPKLAYDITFDFMLALAQTRKPSIPQISYADGLVTITSGTVDAAIRYTTNGLYPSLSSTLYDAPFAADAGVRVLAVAYLDGLNPSDGKELTTA